MLRTAAIRVPIPTPHGAFTAYFTDRGFAELDFPNRSKCVANNGKLSKTQEQWLKLTRAALEQILDGEEPLNVPPLDDANGTEFQRAVWRALTEIPRGETRTYTEIAAAIGRPRAVRAVGSACGANPIPLLIPCHRVVGANGLGGFSGGLEWKKRLLAAEAAALNTR